RDRIPGKCLLDEGGHHASVVGTHPRSVAVEDPGDTHIGSVRAMVGHGERLGVTFGLVVDTAWADRVDVAPVTLALRMFSRVAVDLTGGNQDEPRPVLLHAVEHVAWRRTGRGSS